MKKKAAYRDPDLMICEAAYTCTFDGYCDSRHVHSRYGGCDLLTCVEYLGGKACKCRKATEADKILDGY